MGYYEIILFTCCMNYGCSAYHCGRALWLLTQTPVADDNDRGGRDRLAGGRA